MQGLKKFFTWNKKCFLPLKIERKLKKFQIVVTHYFEPRSYFPTPKKMLGLIILSFISVFGEIFTYIKILILS